MADFIIGIAALMQAGGMISAFFGLLTLPIGDKSMSMAGIVIGGVVWVLGYLIMWMIT